MIGRVREEDAKIRISLVFSYHHLSIANNFMSGKKFLCLRLQVIIGINHYSYPKQKFNICTRRHAWIICIITMNLFSSLILVPSNTILTIFKPKLKCVHSSVSVRWPCFHLTQVGRLNFLNLKHRRRNISYRIRTIQSLPGNNKYF